MTRTFELRLLDSTRLAPPARSAEAAAPPRFAEAASLIRRSPAFARASEATIEALSARVRIARYEIGTVLTRGMAPPRSHVFLIAEGLVEVFARLRKDRQMLCGLLEAPGVLGDDELYGSGAWTLTARAAKPTTAVLIPNDAFEEVVRTDLEVAAGLYREACARHSRMCAILQFMSLEPTERQLLRLLWDLAERPPAAAGAGPDAAADVAPIAIAPLCQTRLARALAVDRKTIARNLKRLIASGALRPVMLEGKKRHAALLVDRRARGTSTPTGTFRRSAMTWRLSSIERYRAS